MAMRLVVAFVRPLTREDRLRATLAVAALAKADRIRFSHGDRAATVMGEALSAARLHEVLTEASLPIESIVSSLLEAEEAPLDDAPVPGAAVERVRAIGR